MKHIKILLSILSILYFTGCEDEDKVTMYSDIVEPELNQLGGQNYQITEDSDPDEVAATWTWTEADYGYNAAVNYAVEVDVDQAFSSPAELTAVDGNSEVGVTVSMLNKAASKYISGPGELTFYVRLKATINSIDFECPVDPVFSNVESYTFRAWPAFPSEMYMIGADFGDWDWSADGVVEMTPVNGVDGAFWCIRYFNAANGFKWSSVKAWGGDFFILDEAVGYTTSDGNAFVPSDGLYMVYMDMAAGTITIEQASVYGMGDCFGSWDTETYPFNISGNKMSITTTADGALRMYAASSAATSDWWTREFIVLDGSIVYRGNGPDQDPVNVSAGSVVTLDFNAGKGTIE
jgi:hypothetical protein